MGMLNKQKNIQIAALNARGMTVEAIAKKAGVDVQAVKESLEQRDRDYVELAMMSEVEKKESDKSEFVVVESTMTWYIVYHKKTKVMYAVSQGTHNHGTFTLLVNADGTPMIYEGE